MICFIQINLHGSATAQNLLQQTAAERGAHVQLISEQNWSPDSNCRWVTSTDRKCAVVLTPTSDLTIESSGAGRGFAWLQSRGVRIYSCYNSRSDGEEEYLRFLAEIEHSIRAADQLAQIVIGGDFNAWSLEWGSASNDHRGEQLTALMASLDFLTGNTGSTPTYRRVNAESVIDVTFSRTRSPTALLGWRVLEDIESGSDHSYVEFRLGIPAEEVDLGQIQGWSFRRLNEEALSTHILAVESPTIEQHTSATTAADHLGEYLKSACDASMPRRIPLARARRPVHWWSKDIADLRLAMTEHRRAFQRSVRRRDELATREALLLGYRAKRKDLRKAIRDAQEKSWSDLCKAVEDDPWGLPYRIVSRKIGRTRPGVEARGREEQIADHLFPDLPNTDWSQEPLPLEDSAPETAPEFTLEELQEASRRLPSGKATGPDGVPNEILRTVSRLRPRVLLDVYNVCLTRREFPTTWKTARLVLLHKGPGKPILDHSSYRPLCMLDSVGKLLERLLLTRLNEHLDATGQRSENQYGFRRGRSTEDAIGRVIEIARGAAQGATQHRDLCVVVSLDVKNAFNTAPWCLIDAALRKRKVPQYLNVMIRSYLTNRELQVGDSQARRSVTCGVPQGSVLGPALWSAFYDDLLDTDMPPGVQLVAFADDVALIGTARTGELAGVLINPALEIVSNWMHNHGLKLAPQKSEAAVLTTKYRYNDPVLYVEGHRVPVKSKIRYLGVELDTRLSFTAHVATAAKKAFEAARSIGRLMPNLGGPSQAKRKLLSSVVNSKLLYASPVWADGATRTAKNRNAMSSSQRPIALRTIRAYKTVSTDASLIIASMIPADLLATERSRIRRRREEADPTETYTIIVKQERAITIGAWQRRWDRSDKGRWTHRVLPNIERWMGTSAQVTTYHLTQCLTGHGCFRSYLHRMHRAEDSSCAHCGDADDTAQHTIFECTHWADKREKMRPFLNGRLPTADDVSDILCGPVGLETQNPNVRDAARRVKIEFTSMVESILTEKEEEERLRQRIERE